MICGIEQIKTRAGEDRPVRVLHVWLFLTLGAPLSSHFITKMRSPAELNKSCNLGVLPVMNEILFRKNGTEHFFLVSACCKLFSSVLSLSPAPVSRWHWAWAECNFTGKYSRGKSYHGMWVADNAHVKCIEVFQFKCICLSLGLSVECEPRSDCQHYPVDAGKELVPSAVQDDERVQLLKNVMILLHMAAMNGRTDRLSLHFLHINNVIQASAEEWGEAWCWSKLWSITWSLSTQSRELVALSLFLSLWFVEIEQRTTVQSQFMLKSSTQIMFKQMQTKFVGKPLLHFPPNLIKTLKLIKTIVLFLEYEKRYFKL